MEKVHNIFTKIMYFLNKDLKKEENEYFSLKEELETLLKVKKIYKQIDEI